MKELDRNNAFILRPRPYDATTNKTYAMPQNHGPPVQCSKLDGKAFPDRLSVRVEE